MNFGDFIGQTIPIVGDLMGAQKAEDAGKRRTKALEEIRKLYEGIAVPGYNPYTSSMGDALADPAAIEAQRNALARLSSYTSPGLMDSERAALAEIQAGQRADNRAQQGAILADAAGRGMANSGQTLAARMGAQQSSANQAHLQGIQSLGMAQARALSALSGYGNMASGMRGQSFEEQAARAQARDTAEQFNRDLTQQGFANQMSLAGAKAGTAMNAAEAAYEAIMQQEQMKAAQRHFTSQTASSFAGRSGGGGGGGSSGGSSGGAKTGGYVGGAK